MIREVGVCLLALALPFNQHEVLKATSESTFKVRIVDFHLPPAEYGMNTTLTFSLEFEEKGVYVLEFYVTNSFDKSSIDGKQYFERFVIPFNVNEWDVSIHLKWNDFYGQYERPILHIVLSKVHYFNEIRKHFMLKFPEKDTFDVEAKDGEYPSGFNVPFTDHNGIYIGREIVTLHNFSERKNISRGRYFTLTDLTIDYERTFEGYNVDFYEIGTGSLSFIDYDGAYSRIHATSLHSPSERVIPVKLIFYSREGNVFSYKIRFDELYYDEKTNTMSSTKIVGYEKNEKYFYIPTNNLDTISATQFTLKFTLNVINEYTFTYKFYLNESDSFFGSCYDSYFCQVVEQADDSEVDESKVEVNY